MNNVYEVNKVGRKYVFSPEQKELIVDLYCNKHLSTVKIGELFGVGYLLICRLLDSCNVQRDHQSKRRYELNTKYFDSINTPNKAYILGFLYADGSNCKSKGTITMSLQEEDKDILERIRLEVGSACPLEYLDYSEKHDFGYNYKNQYRLKFHSSHMCNSLEEMGMVPNKSLVLDFPDIAEDLYSHFIRGYFDGDGSVGLYPNSSNPQLKHGILTITSTESFCSRVKKILETQAGVIGGGIYDAACHNGVTRIYSIDGKNVLKILEWLYKDADLYLQRKYDRYIQIRKYYSGASTLLVA